ncbi:MAG: PepSY-associated TM helix domain-containing protein [Saprospiraceae bacterium]|nr:PepSY-associated TM helix domain-containing protein [Saprospiraceae bacterium]
MKYKYIKKIHLYACLATVALLTMFIITSYMMIHHSWVDHELVKTEKKVELKNLPKTDSDWKQFAQDNNIEGRKIREQVDKNGNQTITFASAGGSAKIVIPKDEDQATIAYEEKKTGNAIIGIHRQSGYGGSWYYNLYAFLLDLIGIGLIVFTITGIIMWFKLLKNNKLAWIIFISGFVYIAAITFVLMTW